MITIRKQIQQLRQVLNAIATLDRPHAQAIATSIGISNRTVRSKITELKSLGAPIEVVGHRHEAAYRLVGDFKLGAALAKLAQDE